ncbi:hydroxylase [Mycobacterium intermedium]|uniref:Hydroxylase n=1 Tax=Mycobacterium intermedium TaxID=28445 RepID=A0A1E3S4T0_MYCIE|nr:VOC family protein [Mycobacterium intermedium]MCV6967840.1 VOC family protein [Mycobacterium intermedium]ODQ97100.1 hydroxylase [Mycobacterium intermedium]OPE47813.1 hydroxylase [Mycobacterium intermedium]ORA95396.1 hydroxylase [Mycobacterium intermedium]
MPIRDDAPLGAPCWIDLTTSDVDRAQEFYAAVFGWTYESAGPEYGGYINVAKDGRPVAGMMANNPEWQAPDNWATYFRTDDINATSAAIGPAGGSGCIDPMEIPAKGFMSVAADPSGASFGLWQPLEHHGFELIGEAGAPVWHQLTTRDYRAAIDFYREVLGWRTESESDTDEFRYTTAWFGDQQLLGVMDGSAILPPDVPSQWSIFFGADDVDKALQVITDHGGAIVRGAEDTPYGRLAAATDPTGVAFNLSSLQS